MDSLTNNWLELFATLEAFDTPTICNALELVDSGRKDYGYTDEVMFCLHQNMSPIVGFAKTATCRSLRPDERTTQKTKEDRVEYYKYINEGDYPKIVVMQDIDGSRRGHGPFWGEFNTRVHQFLGCKGVITDGTIRDVPNLPDDFHYLSLGIKPSHGYTHIVDYDTQVNVCSMLVSPGDIIHADVHGAVAFPISIGWDVVKKAKDFQQSEEAVIEACKNPNNLTFDRLMEIYLKR